MGVRSKFEVNRLCLPVSGYLLPGDSHFTARQAMGSTIELTQKPLTIHEHEGPARRSAVLIILRTLRIFVDAAEDGAVVDHKLMRAVRKAIEV